MNKREAARADKKDKNLGAAKREKSIDSYAGEDWLETAEAWWM